MREYCLHPENILFRDFRRATQQHFNKFYNISKTSDFFCYDYKLLFIETALLFTYLFASKSYSEMKS